MIIKLIHLAGQENFRWQKIYFKRQQLISLTISQIATLPKFKRKTLPQNLAEALRKDEKAVPRSSK